MSKLVHVLHTKVNEALNQIRPFLQEDGGDVELLDITQDNIVVLKFMGSCTTCTMNKTTFEAGIKNTILNTVPEVKDVIHQFA